MAARGSLANSGTTKTALLDAAQEHFSSQGVAGASLRAIQRTAGLAPGTLQYHFTTREELLKALLAREQAGINRKVVALAADLAAQDRAPDARALIDVLAIPYIEFVRADPLRAPQYLRILAQLAGSGDPKILPMIGELRQLFPALLARAFPHARPTEANAAIVMAARALFFLLASYATDDADMESTEGQARIGGLLRFVAGGLEAVLGNTASQ
jgi:AcrR family transcriptional regulator